MPEKRKTGKSPSERGRIIPDVQLLEEILNNLLYVGLHAKNLG